MNARSMRHLKKTLVVNNHMGGGTYLETCIGCNGRFPPKGMAGHRKFCPNYKQFKEEYEGAGRAHLESDGLFNVGLGSEPDVDVVSPMRWHRTTINIIKAPAELMC